ncbi:class I SAM-dependent methyltransferase [Aquimarina sp. TRL1]|nr:class I SAM-dependent methyltransferase [Aquimarina sp. TRL1]
MSETEIKELAEQLSCPNGKKGIDIANLMNETNISMTLQTANALKIADYDIILEIGHGNCEHLSRLFDIKQTIKYNGLEISELMREEAIHINQFFIKENGATFTLYNGEQIPFQDHYFDKIMTVNTIYFWRNPTTFLNELYRVLKGNGRVNITYAHKDFMEKLPFTKYGFTLYDDEKIVELIRKSPFKIEKKTTFTETITSKTGTAVERFFSVVSLIK